MSDKRVTETADNRIMKLQQIISLIMLQENAPQKNYLFNICFIPLFALKHDSSTLKILLLVNTTNTKYRTNR